MADQSIEQIKQRLDIVELIQEYVPLTKTGSNWRGLCPFHNEKTPSFMVSQEKQIWHCFGCNKGGDIFSFIQEIEGGEFGEVLRKLADRAGVVLPQRQTRANERNDRLLQILAEAKRFYEDTLQSSSAGESVRRYVHERGITEASQRQFGLGYSYDDWRKLIQYLQQKQYSVADIVAAGLAIEQRQAEGNAYDRFRGRLMIPLCDHHGTVVGFTARTLKADEPGGKYINSPQSAIYDKSKIVYGLFHAKAGIKKAQAAIVVEGNLDVITAHQAGFTNVVATSGTAFTADQLLLLKRYTTNLILAFDMDAAGQKAVARGVELAWHYSLNVKVLTLPEQYKDPDECIRAQPAQFTEAIQHARHVMDWWFDLVIRPLNFTNVEDKKTASRELLPIIAKLPDTVEQSHYLQKLADYINVDATLLQQKLQQRTPVATPVHTTTPSPAARLSPAVKSRAALLSNQVMALVLSVPDQFSYVADYLDAAFLTDDAMADLYKRMLDHYNKAGQFVIETYLQEHPEDGDLFNVLELQRTAYFPSATAQELQNELIKGIRDLHKAFIQRRMRELESALRQADSDGRIDEAEQLVHELQILMQQLTDLTRDHA